MKKIIILIILLLVTGCNCNYEIELNSKSIDENITVDIYDSDLDPESGDDPSFIFTQDVSPYINDNDKKYEKTITEIDNGKEVNLKYTFTPDDYKLYSYVFNNCFENTSFDYKDGAYSIKLSGYFYCMYGDELNITIKSDKKIKSANGKKKGNGYTWTIDMSNYENIDIEIETTNESMVRYYIYIGIAIVFGIAVLIFIIYFIGNFMGRNNVNDI